MIICAPSTVFLLIKLSYDRLRLSIPEWFDYCRDILNHKHSRTNR